MFITTNLKLTDDGTEIQAHGFAAKSFRFKGGLLNHIVDLSPNKSLKIKQLLYTTNYDLMLNCLPFVAYVVLSQTLSRKDENRDNLALMVGI